MPQTHLDKRVDVILTDNSNRILVLLFVIVKSTQDNVMTKVGVGSGRVWHATPSVRSRNLSEFKTSCRFYGGQQLCPQLFLVMIVRKFQQV